MKYNKKYDVKKKNPKNKGDSFFCLVAYLCNDCGLYSLLLPCLHKNQITKL